MTTLTEATQAIYKTISDSYVASNFTFENEVYNPSGNFIRVSVIVYNNTQETLGAVNQRKFQRRGAIAIQIFTEKDKGTSEAITIKEAIKILFEGKSGLEGTNVYTGPIQTVFIGQDGRYRQENIDIEFTFFETR